MFRTGLEAFRILAGRSAIVADGMPVVFHRRPRGVRGLIDRLSRRWAARRRPHESGNGRDTRCN